MTFVEGLNHTVNHTVCKSHSSPGQDEYHGYMLTGNLKNKR